MRKIKPGPPPDGQRRGGKSGYFRSTFPKEKHSETGFKIIFKQNNPIENKVRGGKGQTFLTRRRP